MARNIPFIVTYLSGAIHPNILYFLYLGDLSLAIAVLADVLALSEENYMRMFARSFFDEWFRITLVVHKPSLETFSALLALCTGNSSGTGEFPSQRPVTQSFDIFFDLHLNKRLSKQSWGWWFETPSRSLWRHCNVLRAKILANPTSNMGKCRTASRAWNYNCAWNWFIPPITYSDIDVVEFSIRRFQSIFYMKKVLFLYMIPVS